VTQFTLSAINQDFDNESGSVLSMAWLDEGEAVVPSGLACPFTHTLVFGSDGLFSVKTLFADGLF
jgi:hypothetical protein